MGIWERLGNVIKSYINDDYKGYVSGSGGSGSAGSRRHGDPDLDAAYEELDDFLQGGAAHHKREAPGERPIPPELREDFAELGLTPGASPADCKAAYKKLLKIHHPDRHTTEAEAMKKATEKTARVNAAYRRLEKWFKQEK